MLFPESIFRSNFFIKLRSWEYWPFGILQFPVFFYFAWLSFRARSITFFSAANPGITMGGLFGESKYDILRKIPPSWVPKTILIEGGSSTTTILKIIDEAGFQFPVIFKPELGERGFFVRRIHNERDVTAYVKQMKYNFLVQELVDFPCEFSVFYARYPSRDKGIITSVVMKEMLTVTGDGKSTLQQLILQKDRAKLQWNSLQKTFHDRLSHVIPAGEEIVLVQIGNHCLGTKFINRHDLINDVLHQTFDHISKQIPGFYFGRYDLRCKSIQDLYTGNIKIMELNGCGAEPAHIYHPGFSFTEAIGILLGHWRTIYEIARENNDRGITYISYREAMFHYRNFKQRVTT
ncbi:MAG TPA: hypothetical protein VD884_02895 [Ohtaekwangia sp.]|nr:hypothetical protein [Ohtaekwangia sp.]